MSQAEVPTIQKSHFTNSAGWRDVDFYRIKLVVDRADNVGFWYYLYHPRQALRDFRLWLKFGKLIAKPVKTKARATTFFKSKKATAPKNISTPKAAEPVKTDADATKKQLEVLVDELKQFGTVEIKGLTLAESLDVDKRLKLRACFDLALKMQAAEMIANTKEALDEQVDQVLKFDDKAFASFKKTIEEAIKNKNNGVS